MIVHVLKWEGSFDDGLEVYADRSAAYKRASEVSDRDKTRAWTIDDLQVIDEE